MRAYVLHALLACLYVCKCMRTCMCVGGGGWGVEGWGYGEWRYGDVGVFFNMCVYMCVMCVCVVRVCVYDYVSFII